MQLGVWISSRSHAEVQAKHHNREERCISDLESCIALCTRWADLSVSDNGLKKRKCPVSGSALWKNSLLMSEVRREWADFFELIGKQKYYK